MVYFKVIEIFVIAIVNISIISASTYAEIFGVCVILYFKWVGQASVSLLAQDEELMQLAVESGCKARKDKTSKKVYVQENQKCIWIVSVIGLLKQGTIRLLI